ncbi:MAG: DUF4157 domain-containing protein, partial [Casimicrobium sp.]
GASSISVDALKGILTTALSAGLAKGLPINNAIEEMATKFGEKFTKDAIRKVAEEFAKEAASGALKGAGGNAIDAILNDDNWRKGAAEYFAAIAVGMGKGGIKGGLTGGAQGALKEMATQTFDTERLKKVLEDNAAGTLVKKTTENTIDASVSEAANYLENMLTDQDNKRFEDIAYNMLLGILKSTAKDISQDKLKDIAFTLRLQTLANIANGNTDSDLIIKLVEQQVKELNLLDKKHGLLDKDGNFKFDRVTREQIIILIGLVDPAKQKAAQDNPTTGTPRQLEPTKGAQTQEPDAVQRDRMDGGELQPAAPQLNELSGGRPLEGMQREQLEAHFKTDLSDVRIHTGPQANSQAQSIGANAFTRNNDIVLSNQANPNDRALVGHEVAHVVQQRGGNVPGGIDAAPQLETAAQQEGTRFANQGGAPQGGTRGNGPITDKPTTEARVATA